jgi:hypothetical protein
VSRIENKSFHKETIVVDGNEYTGCQFQECALVYQGGTVPRFSSNKFESCHWIFDAAAARTVAFMQSLHAGGFESVIEQTLQGIRTHSNLGVTRQ